MAHRIHWAFSGLSALLLAASACAQTDHVYFGNLHSHTGYSDGSGLPPEAYARARNVAGCDFFAITEHNHDIQISPKDGQPKSQIIARTPANYFSGANSLAKAADAATIPGQFVAIYGQEVSTNSHGNHVNVFDVPNVVDVADVPIGEFDQLVTWLKKPENLDSSGRTAVLQFNHPDSSQRPSPNNPEQEAVEYGMDDFGSRQDWFTNISALACTIEILNGPALEDIDMIKPPSIYESDYKYYLAQGFRLAPSADQDNHHKTWGTMSTARTCVITDDLTRPKILQALRDRHVYASSDKNLRVIARVNNHLCGDVLPAPTADMELDIRIDIHDDDEPNVPYSIDIFRGVAGSGVIATKVDSVSATGNGVVQIEDIHVSQPKEYVFFRLVQQDSEDRKDKAWTAPVWFGDPLPPGVSGGSSGPATPPPTDPSANFVASRRSEVYHTNPNCPSAKQIKPENRVTGAAATDGRHAHDCPPM